MILVNEAWNLKWGCVMPLQHLLSRVVAKAVSIHSCREKGKEEAEVADIDVLVKARRKQLLRGNSLL